MAEHDRPDRSHQDPEADLQRRAEELARQRRREAGNPNAPAPLERTREETRSLLQRLISEAVSEQVAGQHDELCQEIGDLKATVQALLEAQERTPSEPPRRRRSINLVGDRQGQSRPVPPRDHSFDPLDSSFSNLEDNQTKIERAALRRSCLNLITSLDFNPRRPPSPNNPRHLEGFMERLNDPNTRVAFLQLLYGQFHHRDTSLELPQWVFHSQQVTSFEEIVRNMTHLQDLKDLEDILHEVRTEGVMSRYDFSQLGPRQVALLSSSSQFQLYHRRVLETHRNEDISAILTKTGLEELKDLGPFDYVHGLYSSLVRSGIIAGNPTFPPGEADIHTANLHILRKAIDEELLEIRPNGRGLRLRKSFLFYQRTPDNERPHLLIDYASIAHDGRIWRLTEKTRKYLTN